MDPYSHAVLWIVIVSFIVALALAFGIGANDVANSFGTSVGARVLTLRQACLLASFFEVAGSVLIGYGVSETVRKGIIDTNQFVNHEPELMLGSLAALIGSALWNIIATLFAMPISGTHTVVGATIGFALVARGTGGIKWVTLGEIVASWFISPILSGTISVVIFLAIRYVVLRAKDPQQRGRLLLPFFFGFTVLLNIFSIVIDGPELLKLNNLPVWASVVISVAAGLATGTVIQLLLVPRVERKQKETSAELDARPPTPPDTAAKTGETNSAFTGEGDGGDAEKAADAAEPANYGTVKDSASAETPSTTEDDAAAAKAVVQDVPGEALMFAPLQIMTACFGSFAHGGNDVSNAIGPLTAVWLIYQEGSATQKAETPIYVLFYGGVGIVIGLWALGRRVMRTIGEDLTQLTPASGFSVELGSAATVLFASKIGVPVSTTHCKVGSVISVGWGRTGRGGVSWKLFGGIAAAWLITVPFAAASSAVVMAIFKAASLY